MSGGGGGSGSQLLLDASAFGAPAATASPGLSPIRQGTPHQSVRRSSNAATAAAAASDGGPPYTVPPAREVWLHNEELRRAREHADSERRLVASAREDQRLTLERLQHQLAEHAAERARLQAELDEARELLRGADVGRIRLVEYPPGAGADASEAGPDALRSAVASANSAEHVLALQAHVRALKAQLHRRLDRAEDDYARLATAKSESDARAEALARANAALAARVDALLDQLLPPPPPGTPAATSAASSREAMRAASAAVAASTFDLATVQTRLAEYCAWEAAQGFAAPPLNGALLDDDAGASNASRAHWRALVEAHVRERYRASLLADENARLREALAAMQRALVQAHVRLRLALAGGEASGEASVPALQAAEEELAQARADAHALQTRVEALAVELAAPTGAGAAQGVAGAHADTAAAQAAADAAHWQAQARRLAGVVRQLKADLRRARDDESRARAQRVDAVLTADAECARLAGRAAFLGRLCEGLADASWLDLAGFPVDAYDELAAALAAAGDEAGAVAALRLKQAHEQLAVRQNQTALEATKLREVVALGGDPARAVAAAPAASSGDDARALEAVRLDAAARLLLANQEAARWQHMCHTRASQALTLQSLVDRLAALNAALQAQLGAGDAPAAELDAAQAHARALAVRTSELETELAHERTATERARRLADECREEAARRRREVEWLRQRDAPAAVRFETAVDDRIAAAERELCAAPAQLGPGGAAGYAPPPGAGDQTAGLRGLVARKNDKIELLLQRLALCLREHDPKRMRPVAEPASEAPQPAADSADASGTRAGLGTSLMLRSYERQGPPPPTFSRTHRPGDEDEDSDASSSRELFAPPAHRGLRMQRRHAKHAKGAKHARTRKEHTAVMPSPLRILTMTMLAHAIPTVATFLLEPDEQEVDALADGITLDEPAEIAPLPYLTGKPVQRARAEPEPSSSLRYERATPAP